jgi:hypothetical protein
MIAVSEAAVAIVTSIVITGVIVLLAVLFTRLLRRTRRALSPISASTWLTATGAVIAIAGVVDLIWTQLATDNEFGIQNSARYRWDEAASAIIIVALGLIVCTGAQMLRVMEERAEAASSSDRRSSV